MKWIKRKILNYTLKHLFDAVTEEDILPLKDLEEGQRKELLSQAKFIAETDVWQMMTVDVKTKAQKQMFMKSKSWDDMYFGKAVLYVIDLLDKRLKALSKIKT